jgi:hypothetical protein
MKSVGGYGYTETNLPDGTTTAKLCQG